MVAVEPISVGEGDEELRAIGVGARVCHRQQAAFEMVQVLVFIREFFSVNGHATGTIATGEVATLGHEATDNSVEVTLLIGVAFRVVSATQ